MYSSVTTAAYVGLHGYLVNTEVHIANGLPRFKIVGLPDKSVEEAKERVTAAIKSSGYTFPLKRITVGLSPSHIHKHGSSFDLAIALGILSASRQIPPITSQNQSLFCGELGLDGSIRETAGLPILIQTAIDNSAPSIIIPKTNSLFTSFFESIDLFTTKNLQECTFHIARKKSLPMLKSSDIPHHTHTKRTSIPFSEISGNSAAKRALVIAAAGRHHIAFTGTPGTGKTILAQSVIDLLPSLTINEIIQNLKIYSLRNEPPSQQRPFRNPHHTTNLSSIIGGGRTPLPGEISLAHNGILFLDELADFSKNVLLSLRKPLDDNQITISRSNLIVEFPAHFSLITAMNPCPCGYHNHPTKKCTCNQHHINQYHRRVPGSLWDRIDIHIPIAHQKFPDIKEDPEPNDTHAHTKHPKKLISKMWSRQNERKLFNNDISLAQSKSLCPTNKPARLLLKDAFTSMGLSTRNLLQILRVARTIADIDDKKQIEENHIAEAISYRKQDF